MLWFGAKPLPWVGPPIEFPTVYQFGVAISLALAIGFLAIYLWMVSAEARDRARALVATEAALTRESKMAALGSLAAAAAHELGGPLGTITLIAHSLAEQLGDDPEFGEDIRLLESEAARSRSILVRIAKRAEAEDPFAELGARRAAPRGGASGGAGARAGADRRAVTAAAGAPFTRIAPGLQNLVANAVRHAGSVVELHAAPRPAK